MSRSIQALNVADIDLDGCNRMIRSGEQHAEHIFLRTRTHYSLKGASLDSFGRKQSAAALVLRESISLSKGRLARR